MKVEFTPIVFPDHTVPRGALPNHPGAQACWYFYLLAQKNKEKVGKSTEDQFGLVEGEQWMDKQYVQLARSIATMYGLDSPDEFAKFWKEVKQEAWLCGLPEPADEYTRLAPGLTIN